MNNQSGVPVHEATVRPVTLPVGAVVAAGLVLGIAGDILLRARGGPGLNFFLLLAGLGVAVWMLGRRTGLTLSGESRALIGLGVAFGATLMFRASGPLRAMAFLAAAIAFALPALRAGTAWLRRSGVSEQVMAMVLAGANGLAGAFRLIGAVLAAKPAGSASPNESNHRPVGAVLRGLLLGVPFLFLFGALFMSADRIFSDLVTNFVRFDLEEIASHLLVTAVLTWLGCGYLAGFLSGTRPAFIPERLPSRPRVGIIEIGIALGLVNILFVLFVTVQFRYLFGGSGLVEVTPGLTYAEYVREGFEQLAMACALVLPSLLAADWVLHVRGRRDGLIFRVMAGILLLLLLVIIASAFQRVRAYQAAYGLTDSRFYGAAFLGWLTLLTVWYAGTVLRGRRERFAFPALVSGFGFVALLLAVNPDVRIARTNLARADRMVTVTGVAGKGVDAYYLASLSADAVPTLLDALPALLPEPRCVLAWSLLSKWAPDGSRRPDWRSWNWSEARAREKIGRESEALRAMVAAVDGDVCSGEHG